MQINPTVNKSVTAYLSALVWDGEPRLDRWLIDCAGAGDTPYVRAVSRGALVAAVRRARSPGCKFDQMLIIEGPQGSGKSSALRILAGEDDWFTDDLPYASDACSLMAATEGKWIVELDLDLENMGISQSAALRSCLAKQYDEARMPYAYERTRAARQFVIVGTVNTPVDFHAPNETSGHRRFWPVPVQRFDLEKLRAVRGQLWAEASKVEAKGETIDLEALWRYAENVKIVEGSSVKHTRHLTVALDEIGDIEAVVRVVRMIRGVSGVKLVPRGL